MSNTLFVCRSCGCDVPLDGAPWPHGSMANCLGGGPCRDTVGVPRGTSFKDRDRTWLLLAFRDNYADEFDVESLVVTTSDRWERAQKALREAYPSSLEGFKAYFGTNESCSYSGADDFLSCWTAHEINLATAQVLARVFGRAAIQSNWDGTHVTKRSWFLLVEHGVLPRVPEQEEGTDWLLLLAFPAPPARCTHGNIVGRCDRGRDGVPPGAPACTPDDAEVDDTHDPDYGALMGGGSIWSDD